MPHPINTRPLQLVIPWIRRRLIDDLLGRPPQRHPLPLEPQVRHPRDVLLAAREVVLEEEGQPLHRAELGALDGELLHLGRLREVKGLRGLGLLGRGEVEVEVGEDLEGARRAGGGRREERDGVQLYLAREAWGDVSSSSALERRVDL